MQDYGADAIIDFTDAGWPAPADTAVRPPGSSSRAGRPGVNVIVAETGDGILGDTESRPCSPTRTWCAGARHGAVRNDRGRGGGVRI